MKIACDKCLKPEDPKRAKDWITVSIDKSLHGDMYRLCPDCADGFWRAVDCTLPPIKKPKNRRAEHGKADGG